MTHKQEDLQGTTEQSHLNPTRINDSEVELEREFLPEDPEQASHWFWSNWILLALLSTVSFAITNLVLGDMSQLGPSVACYFNSGSLVFTVVYFAVMQTVAKQKRADVGILDHGSTARIERRVITKWNGKLDWKLIGFLFAGALFQTGILFSITTTFRLSQLANLNIGISQTIWALNPFMSALLDWVVYKAKLQVYHAVGMFGLVLCAIFVSLSEVISPADTGSSSIISAEDKLPNYVPILCSLTMPIICTFFVLIGKHMTVTLKMNALDWTFGYFLIMSVVLQIVGIVYFIANPGVFVWSYWIQGFISAITNLLGVWLANAAIATNKPIGPILALLNCQTIIIVVTTAIRLMQLPSWIQLIGLICGILGAFTLTIPDQMYQLYYILTRCRRPKHMKTISAPVSRASFISN